MTDQRVSTDAITRQHSALIEEFRALLAKYPASAEHFALAYLPADHRDPSAPITIGITQPVFECTKIEPGLVMCERVDEQ
ncbi:hypothetical protein [Nocardia aurea]|uniref:hypothetical protein n=1 Tax=Nocardia aurea TaxID=2144174 RepID=UPI0033BA0551